MRALGLMTCCTVLLAGCSFTTAGGLTECETSADCDSAQVCNAGFCLPQPLGCGDVFGPTSEPNPIPIGVALPLTTAEGRDASEEQALNSIKLALGEVNQREGINGRKFILYICDTASDAAQKGIKSGDVILAINDLAVKSPADLVNGVKEATKLGRKAVLMRVKSGTETRFVPVQLKKS